MKKKSISDVHSEKKKSEKINIYDFIRILTEAFGWFFSWMLSLLCVFFLSHIPLFERSSRTITHSHADSFYLIEYQIKCNYEGLHLECTKTKKIITLLVFFKVPLFSYQCDIFNSIFSVLIMLHLNHDSWYTKQSSNVLGIIATLDDAFIYCWLAPLWRKSTLAFDCFAVWFILKITSHNNTQQ